MTPEEALALWHRALSTPLGLSITTTNPTLLKQKLYQARKFDQDPLLDILTIVAIGPGEIWICRKDLE